MIAIMHCHKISVTTHFSINSHLLWSCRVIVYSTIKLQILSQWNLIQTVTSDQFFVLLFNTENLIGSVSNEIKKKNWKTTFTAWPVFFCSSTNKFNKRSFEAKNPTWEIFSDRPIFWLLWTFLMMQATRTQFFRARASRVEPRRAQAWQDWLRA